MGDLEDLRARHARGIAAWNAHDVDAVIALSGGEEGAGFGYRTRRARTAYNRSPEESRAMLQAFFDSVDFYEISDVDWHGSIDGDTAIESGSFIESFQHKGRSAERVRVRFTEVSVRRDGEWKHIWAHRDAQQFDEQGSYIPQPVGSR